jgi:hypothetical protein
LKNSEAQAKAVSASRLTKLSNKALYNYSAAVKQASPAAFALRTHKAFILKVD